MKNLGMNIYNRLKKVISMNLFFGSLIGVLCFIAIFLFSITGIYETFEVKLYDFRFQLKPTFNRSVNEWDRLSFLNVDENSINNIGEYPWPRHIYSKGLEVLKEVGIRQVGFDFEFQDRSNIQINSEALDRLNNRIDIGKRIRKDELAGILLDNDNILAEGIKLVNRVILPYHFQKETVNKVDIDEDYREEKKKAKEDFTNRASIKVPEEHIKKYEQFIDRERVGIAMPIPEFVKVAHAFGFVDRDPDIDGTERRIRLIRFFEGRLYFQMGLVMLIDLCQVKMADIIIEPGERIVIPGAINPINHQKEDIAIPIDEKGMMYINWAGPGPLEKSFHHISFYALFEYPIVKDDVYDYFDEQEIGSGKKERSNLYGELDNRYSKFYASKDLSVKKENWQRIKEIRERIREIEKGYTKPIVEQISRIKEELKTGKDEKLEQSLFDLNNYLTAINIVLEVESLRDSTAVIGMTATGTQDLGVIPTYSEYMMVGTYPNIVNTIINKSFIIRVNDVINYILMFILSLLMGLITQHLGARMSLFIIAVSLFVANFIIISLFVFHNIWIDELGLTLSIFLPSSILTAIKFIREENQKRFIKHAFSHYLSPKVIDEIINEPDLLKLGGESRHLTIFFSDVAKFSTISEALEPVELVQLLNEYLSEMTDIILEYNGTVDKYEGDAIMAFFGAPQHLPDHAARACFASIDMQMRLEEMRTEWRKQGKHELLVRMGLNTGEAVVGNMGSRERMDYTVMGDAVNLASRLEGANKVYNTYSMISGNTYEEAKDHIEARPLDVIRVVGKDEPIQVYELMGRKGNLSADTLEMLDKYNKGLELFRERDWKKARSQFRAALRIINDDGPSKTYYERCYEFSVSPPPKNWDGVYKMKGK
ncbi:MAG: adenylate/guanylate cyclase domain-containing protein [Spirochaetota bacterium]|nr:adenylate/guanylate cyclase domain-containing protein [Spirochaetota bacterium]